MRKPTAVIEFDLAGTSPSDDLANFGDAQVLVQLGGRPLGFVTVPVIDGSLERQTLLRQIVHRLGWRFALALAQRAADTGDPPLAPDTAALMRAAPASGAEPLVTV